MKARDLRYNSNEELEKMIKTLKIDLMRERSLFGAGSPEEKAVRKNAGKKGQKTSMIKNIRRTIARIKTIQNERLKGIN